MPALEPDILSSVQGRDQNSKAGDVPHEVGWLPAACAWEARGKETQERLMGTEGRFLGEVRRGCGEHTHSSQVGEPQS